MNYAVVTCKSEIYCSEDSKGMMYYVYVCFFLVNAFLETIQGDFDKPIKIN